MPFHNKLKSFIEKAKEKQEERSYKAKDKMARSKGFSSYRNYELQTGIARKEGYDQAQKDLRKNEIKQAKKKEYMNTLDTRPKYVKKLESGIESFHKGMNEYNTVMNELKSIGNPFNNGKNTNQAYASGYGPYNPGKPKRRKKSKSKKQKQKKAKLRQVNDVYSWARNY